VIFFVERRDMKKQILFSLEHCVKCQQTKDLLKDREDVDIITFPHDIINWSAEELEQAKVHDVFDDLQITAPILWLDGEKKVGYLRIRKWLQDTN
jgi:glutaredoxin